jgi:hypothetical protein
MSKGFDWVELLVVSSSRLTVSRWQLAMALTSLTDRAWLEPDRVSEGGMFLRLRMPEWTKLIQNRIESVLHESTNTYIV